MQREFRTSRMQQDHQIRLVDSCEADVPRVSSRSSVRVGKNVVPLATDKKLNSEQLCLPFEPVVSRDDIATLVRVYLLIQECRRVRLDVLVNHISAQLKCDEKVVHQVVTTLGFVRIKLTNGVAFVSSATATSKKKVSDVKLMQFEEAMTKLFVDSQGERIQLSHVINVLSSVLKRSKQHCYQMLRASSEYKVVGSVATGKYVYKYASN